MQLEVGKDKNKMFKSYKVLLLRQHISRSTFSFEANHITTGDTILKRVYLFYGGSSPIRTLSGAELNAKQPVDPLDF